MAATQEPSQRNMVDEARLLMQGPVIGTLATVEGDVPHAALVTPAFMPDRTPVLLLSQLSMHTRQLQANPACALLLVRRQAQDNAADPQTIPRLCLTGTAAATADMAVKKYFLAAHPNAGVYADFADFAFWRIVVTKAYYVGGFSVAGQLAVAKLLAPP